MKKLLLSLLVVCCFSFASFAQVKEQKTKTATSKTKTKNTSTLPQKVHNVIHPHRKHYNGVKMKAKKKH